MGIKEAQCRLCIASFEIKSESHHNQSIMFVCWFPVLIYFIWALGCISISQRAVRNILNKITWPKHFCQEKQEQMSKSWTCNDLLIFSFRERQGLCAFLLLNYRIFFFLRFIQTITYFDTKVKTSPVSQELFCDQLQQVAGNCNGLIGLGCVKRRKMKARNEVHNSILGFQSH